MTENIRSQRASEVSEDRVKIRFGAQLQKHLSQLRQIVGNYSGDQEFVGSLDSLISGKPMEIGITMASLVQMKDQVRNYEENTSNRQAMNVFDEAMDQLISGRNHDDLIFTVDPQKRLR